MRNQFCKVIITIFFAFFISFGYGQETACNNGIDDDNDGFIDCADSECYDSNSCEDAFTCSNALFQVISNTLNQLDPLTGIYTPIGNASGSYNGAGYNVQDGYIYGIKKESSGVHLWKINARGTELDLGQIENYSGRTYVGDFDDMGNLYTYTSGLNSTLSYIDVDASPIRSIQKNLTNLTSGTTPGAADITYNPIHKVFYGLSSSHQLFALDPIAETSRIVGDYSAFIDVSGSFGAGWSDKDGNSYFSNNNTGKIFRFTFNADHTVDNVAFVATGQPTNSNDGMGCFFALPPFETDCTDGIDNDGDGLTDCDDPDCANAGKCPAINIQIRSIEEAGPMSIVPMHIELVNNSNVDAIDFTFKSELPDGFSFVSDSIQYSEAANFSGAKYPKEEDRNLLAWQGLSIPVGDTIIISYSLLVDLSIQDSKYTFDFTTDNVIQSPFKLDHSLNIKTSIFTNPTSYGCVPSFYQVYKKKRLPNVLARLNPETAMYDQISVISHQANGLGFDKLSGFAYGSDGKRFIRIDDKGNVSYMGISFDKKVYVGDVDTLGNWYGRVGNTIVKLSIDQNKIISQFPNQGIPGWDMAYNKDGHFYSVHGSQLYRFNTLTNSKEELGALSGEEIPNSGHGAQWTGVDGYHYISNNTSGKIFRIDINEGTAKLCMVAESNLQFNDGFACPDALPVVFQYEHGDLLNFPIARYLAYEQDIKEDAIPDYAMVWLGKGISTERIDPSNSSATGDTHDDGFMMGLEYEPGSVNTAQLTINTNRENMKAQWGIWIDWNEDGTHDDYYSGSEIVSGDQVVNIPIQIPNNFTGKTISVRVRASEFPISEQNFAGDILEPGEVEDYIFSGDNSEICDNGIDDDNDGLIDCDDPDCADSCDYTKSSSAGTGGLESNDNLIDKITQTLFERKREGLDDIGNRNNLSQLSGTTTKSAGQLSGEFSIADLIPIDVIEDTETFVNSPSHLIDVTNAVDLFAVDIYEKENRVAAVLALETESGVYEHTKYICDRLTGSKILDIFKTNIDNEHQVIVAKMELPDGNIEYATSFSLRKKSLDNMVFESYWNLEDYTKGVSFYNFQIWANNTKHLFELHREIVRLVKQRTTLDGYLVGEVPSVYIQSGRIDADKLVLDVVNLKGVKYLNTVGTYSLTETTEATRFEQEVALTGDIFQSVKLDIGDVYYLGLAFHHPDIVSSDAIFLANGAWGYYVEDENETLSSYEITTTQHFFKNKYALQRGVVASGDVKNYISFYRSFAPRFTAKDLESFNSLCFKASGIGTLEIAVMKEGTTRWAEQGKILVELSDQEREFVIGKEFFKDANGSSNSWVDANMVVINVLGDGTSSQAFKLSMSDFYFGHQSIDNPFLIYTDRNLIAQGVSKHIANSEDGTEMGEFEVGANFDGASLNVTIENISDADIILDDIELLDSSGSFILERFEPSEIEAAGKTTFSVSYVPLKTPNSTELVMNLFIDTDKGFLTIPVNISAAAICQMKDHVSTINLTTMRNKEYNAIESVTTNASVEAHQNITFSAQEEVILLPGFEVALGGEIQAVSEDRCKSKN